MCASNKGNLSPQQAEIKMLLANTCNAYNATPAYFDRQRPYVCENLKISIGSLAVKIRGGGIIHIASICQ